MKKTEDLKSQVFVLCFQHKEKVQDVAKKL